MSLSIWWRFHLTICSSGDGFTASSGMGYFSNFKLYAYMGIHFSYNDVQGYLKRFYTYTSSLLCLSPLLPKVFRSMVTEIFCICLHGMANVLVWKDVYM